jgi:dolichyl-diphosphooligosaccharide--protein glycosyltransferase
MARHLADYVLVWAGGGGDDLAKVQEKRKTTNNNRQTNPFLFQMPHVARIASSVYDGICPGGDKDKTKQKTNEKRDCFIC